MARLSDGNTKLAREIIARYPKPRSAMIPLLHLAQEQDGWVTEDAMAHIGELVGATPAEVYGTASFYEMFKFHPVGKYVINICGTMSCALMGSEELMHHAEQKLGVRMGGTTDDGMFTLERAECQAACTEAPCLQTNYRFSFRVTNESFDALVDDLRAGRLDNDVPPHGTVARVRQSIPSDRQAGIHPPDEVRDAPEWFDGRPAL